MAGPPLPRDDRHLIVVQRIVDEMLTGKWRSGRSHQAFMKEFDVSLSTVKNWASEAYLFIRMCQGSKEDIRARILAGIETAQTLSLERKRFIPTQDGDVIERDDPDVKTYVQSLEFYARVHGADKPDDEQREQVTEAELAELLKARGWKVEAPNAPEEERVPQPAADTDDQA